MKALATTRLAVLAAFAVMGVAAHATMLDATVLIDRAANDRTLTVRYNGANAALVELRINGVSTATRMVDQAKNTGETSFTLDTAALNDGENNIEIRLYNEDGKVVGTQKSSVVVDRKASGPVRLERPTSGSTVQGIIEVKLGLEKNLRNIYVSFFIDDNFTALRNFPPYSYAWDTLNVPNGWHEIQAVVVDEANNTFKTEKMRVFVANPGGNTVRNNAGGTTGNTTDVRTGETAGLKPMGADGKPLPGPAPKGPNPTGNKINPKTGGAIGTKPITAGSGLGSGQQALLPKGGATPIAISGGKASDQLATTANMILATRGTTAITHGTRLSDVGIYAIMMDGEYINFDVSPRVENGVPLTPFRHLFEHGGGKVEWKHELKEVQADGMGRSIWFKVGYEFAKVDGKDVRFEMSPFVDSSRVLVPLSFITDSLNVNVNYDANTGHVIVTQKNVAEAKK